MDLSLVFLQRPSFSFISDHQPSQTPNKALKQNVWAAGFPISAAATEKWDEKAKENIYFP